FAVRPKTLSVLSAEKPPNSAPLASNRRSRTFPENAAATFVAVIVAGAALPNWNWYRPTVLVVARNPTVVKLGVMRSGLRYSVPTLAAFASTLLGAAGAPICRWKVPAGMAEANVRMALFPALL